MAAVVAHEVRNPLAGIKGAMQVLMSRRAAGDAELPVMRDIVARIDALSELINDLMCSRGRARRGSATSSCGRLIAEAVTIVRRDPGAAVASRSSSKATDVSASATMSWSGRRC